MRSKDEVPPKPYAHKEYPSYRFKHGEEAALVHSAEQAEDFEDAGYHDCPKKAKEAHEAASKKPPVGKGKGKGKEDKEPEQE